METDPRFWDCECKDNYIHPKDEPMCQVCGKHQDEQPDSIVVEVEKFLKNTQFARMDINPKDLSLHMSRYSTVRTTLDLHETMCSRGIDVYGPSGALLGEINIRLSSAHDGLEIDLTRGGSNQEVRILAWAEGKLIANKPLPSNGITVMLKPALGDGR